MVDGIPAGNRRPPVPVMRWVSGCAALDNPLQGNQPMLPPNVLYLTIPCLVASPPFAAVCFPPVPLTQVLVLPVAGALAS
jgi:hypothetical protein